MMTRYILAGMLVMSMVSAGFAGRIVILDERDQAQEFAEAVGGQIVANLPDDLAPGDVVVITPASEISRADEDRLEAMVRSGVGLLASHTVARNSQAAWERWFNTPIGDVLPAVMTPKGSGIMNYYGRTRLAEAAEHPITEGVDFSARPAAEFHTPVVTPMHPTLSRHLLWPVWPDSILKSMINGEWTDVLWGSDAERRCLLAVGRYGAGRTAMMGVDYAGEGLTGWASYGQFAGNLVGWLSDGDTGQTAQPTVVALVVDAPAVFSLRRMGINVLTEIPDDMRDVAAVVVGDVPADRDAATVAAYVREGGALIALSPQAMQAPALRQLAGVEPATAPMLSQVWNVSVEVGGGYAQRRPPRLTFDGDGPRWAATVPIPRGRGRWGFYATSRGWVEIPAGGGDGFALAFSDMQQIKVGGDAAVFTDVPPEFRSKYQQRRWLPLDELAAGRHEIELSGAAITHRSVELIDLSSPPDAPATAIARPEGWRYQSAGAGIGLPSVLPELDAEGWRQAPPRVQAPARPNPTLVPLPEPPQIELPAEWKMRQSGDLLSDFDMVERWYAPGFDDSGWASHPIRPLRRMIDGREHRWDHHNGAVWYRASISIPAGARESGGFLLFDGGNAHVTVYADGREIVGRPRKATVPLSALRQGDNLLAVRVWRRERGAAVSWGMDGLAEVQVVPGTVRYRADRDNVGVAEEWFRQPQSSDDEPQVLNLPGRPEIEPVNWLWLVLDGGPDHADTTFRVRGPSDLQVWLNGEPVEIGEWAQSVTVPGERLREGRNTVVIRKLNRPAWAHHPGIRMSFGAPDQPQPVFARTTVMLPEGVRAIRMPENTPRGLLYAGRRLLGHLAPGAHALTDVIAGEHELTMLLLDGDRAPAIEFLADVPGRRVPRLWGEHPPSAQPPAIGSGGWEVHIGGQGGALRFDARDDRWFTFDVNVSEAEANQAALLHFTANEARAVEPGLIKEMWVNGQRITPTPRKHAEGLHWLIHKTTMFDLTGLLEPGVNRLVFRPDFSRYKGLDLPVPSDAPWMIPLPVLAFGGEWQRVEIDGPLSRFQPPDNYRRIGFQPDVLPDARPVGRWADGQPLFLERTVGRGAVICAASDLNQFLRLRFTRGSWGGEQNDMEGGALWGNGTYQIVRRDDTQILAGLIRQTAGTRSPVIRTITGGTEPRSAVVEVESREDFNGLLAVRIQSWEGALIHSQLLPLELAAGAVRRVVVTTDQEQGYFGTDMKDELFVRAAVLSADGAAVLDYLDDGVDTTPPVSLNLATDDPSERSLPASVAGAPQYRRIWAEWQPADEALPAFIYLPGETVNLHAAVKNHTDQEQTVTVRFELQARLAGTTEIVGRETMTLAPHEQRWLTFQRELIEDFETFGFVGAIMHDGSERVREAPFSVILPFKDVIDPQNLERAQGFSLHGPGAGLLNIGSFQAPIFDMETIYGRTTTELEWWKLDNLIEAPGNGGGFGTPDIRHNFYWGMFDKGPSSGRNALDNSSFLPSGEHFWEWSGREHRLMLRSRMGDIPTSAEIADWWVQVTMHDVPRNVVQFARRVEVEHGYRSDARTMPALANDLQARFPLEWRWFFTTDAATRNTEMIGTSQSPGSVAWSQMDWVVPALHMLDGHLWAQVAGRWNNAGEPDNGLRRVFVGERFRPYATAAGRALAPDFYLTTSHGNEPGANNMAYSWPHAQGGVGVLPAENFSRGLHSGIWLQVAGPDGRIQPVVNTPNWRNKARLSLFGGVMPYSTGTVAEWHLFGRAFHLMNFIGAEDVMGAGFVVSPQRPSQGDPVPGSYHAGVGGGALNSDSLDSPVRNLWETLRNYGAVVGTFVGPLQLHDVPVDTLVYAIPNDIPSSEVDALVKHLRRGGSLAAFYTTGGNQQTETALSELFDIEFGGDAPARAEYRIADSPAARAVLGDDLAGRAGTLPQTYTGPNYRHTAGADGDIIRLPGDRVGLKILSDNDGRAAFSSLYGQTDWGGDHDIARALARAVNWADGNPLILPGGIAGTGFSGRGRTFLPVEELYADGGERTLRVRMPAGNYRAVNLVDNLPVPVDGVDGEGYLVLRPSFRPLEAMLIVIQAVE